MRFFSAIILAALFALSTNGLEFEMSSQFKCIYEEINKDVLVVGDFRSYNKENPAVDVQLDVRVEEPQGVVTSDLRARSQGQFAFTSKVSGEYKVCFVLHDAHLVSTTVVKLDWRMGVAATDWSSIAKKEHLDSMTVELRKLDDAIREVYSEMLQLQQREQEMRDISEKTNSRVAWYSIYSLLICVGSGIFQLFYLRVFFKRKKML